jgi:hypothetical protein
MSNLVSKVGDAKFRLEKYLADVVRHLAARELYKS